MRRRWEERDMLKKVFRKLAVVLISSMIRVISAQFDAELKIIHMHLSIYLSTHMCVRIKGKKYIWKICEVWSDSI